MDAPVRSCTRIGLDSPIPLLQRPQACIAYSHKGMDSWEANAKNALSISIAVSLLAAFSAVDLLPPYSLGVSGLQVGLGLVCGLIKGRGPGSECPLVPDHSLPSPPL